MCILSIIFFSAIMLNAANRITRKISKRAFSCSGARSGGAVQDRPKIEATREELYPSIGIQFRNPVIKRPKLFLKVKVLNYSS